MVVLIYHPYLFGGRVETALRGGLCLCRERRWITNLYIDGFNLYYSAHEDTPPRLGSTTRANWAQTPFSVSRASSHQGLYGRGLEFP